MIKFAPTYPASETFDLKLGGVLLIAGSITQWICAGCMVFAVSAPEGLHRISLPRPCAIGARRLGARPAAPSGEQQPSLADNLTRGW
jgi:hypothetical protein